MALFTEEVREIALKDEHIRTYMWEWNGKRYEYSIKNPVLLRPGNTSHRVTDDMGIVHCVPTVGPMGCVIRITPKGAALIQKGDSPPDLPEEV